MKSNSIKLTDKTPVKKSSNLTPTMKRILIQNGNTVFLLEREAA